MFKLTNELNNIDSQDLSLFEVVREVVLRFAEQAEMSKSWVEIDFDCCEIFGKWQYDKIEKLVVSLLTHSILHAPGKHIKIYGTKSDGFAMLYLKDSGYGFARFRQASALGRFVNDDNVNAPHNEIFHIVDAKIIAQKYGGTVKQKTIIGRGSTVEVKLPLKTSAYMQ